MQADEIPTIGDLILVARNTVKAGRVLGKVDAPEIIPRLRFNDGALIISELIVPFPFKN
jgi:hypothetical protein